MTPKSKGARGKKTPTKKITPKTTVKPDEANPPASAKRSRGRPLRESSRIAEMRLNIFIEPQMKQRFIAVAKGTNSHGTAASVVRDLINRWFAGEIKVPVGPSALRDPKRMYEGPLPKMGVNLPETIYLKFKAQTALQGHSMSAVTLTLIGWFLSNR